jgi:hypothetical protein
MSEVIEGPWKEKEEPKITMEFTENQWRGLFSAVHRGLIPLTNEELAGKFEDMPEKVERIDGARKAAENIAKKFQIGIEFSNALASSIIDGQMSDENLRESATNPIVANPEYMKRAQHFLKKERRKNPLK